MIPALLGRMEAKTNCYQFDPVTLGLILGGSSALGSLGNVGSAILGSSSAADAAQAAMTGEAAAIQATYGGAQSAYNILSPYTQGGLQNYDYLNYLLTGQGGQNYQSPALPSVGSIQGLPAGASPAQVQAYMTALQNYIGSFHGDLATKYAGAYSQAQQALTQAQSVVQQQQASAATQGTIAGSTLPANYLTTPFNLQTSMQSGTGNQMLTLAEQQIAAQNAATGGYGSGNQATALANYIGGTFEPTLQSQYSGTQNQIYNYLTGNVGGSGQAANTGLANLYGQIGQAAAPYMAQGGQTQAGSIASQGTAWNNALTNFTNSAQGAGNQFMNYLTGQNIVSAIQNPNSNLGWYNNSAYGQS